MLRLTRRRVAARFGVVDNYGLSHYNVREYVSNHSSIGFEGLGRNDGEMPGQQHK